ncbi:glycosyltransferase family 1 protein [Longirhabdus pacifica]|uniref:glycosyltransferase family 1 protein n=1 Tax=Longirhabdus pacifica TaxID=2305227 RepID=UPI0010088139|nr:glycosyltransferase family 1 protein [Longirhabdus pacifica]
MKILHGTIEIAGQMGIMCKEFKKRGHIASGYNTFHSYLGYEDHIINVSAYEIQSIAHHIMNFYDVFHFHYNSSLHVDRSDLETLIHKNKKVLMHHWGNDVRFHDIAKAKNPFVNTEDSPPNDMITFRLKLNAAYIEHAIVQDYEVYEYVSPYYKHVHVVPIAIDLDKFTPENAAVNNKKPLIVHAPTQPKFKGTNQIEEVIRQLKHNYDFDYMRIEKMNHHKAREFYQKADIIIDQILCGSYGLLAVEGMALGKPIVGYIREDLVNKFPPELPIANANPNTLYEKLQCLLENKDFRTELGLKGSQYAKEVHDKEVVASQLLGIYKQI